MSLLFQRWETYVCHRSVPCSAVTLSLQYIRACVCLTLWDLVDCSWPGSFVHGVLQARILELVAMPSCRESSLPRDQTCVSFISCIGRQILYHCTPWEAPQPIRARHIICGNLMWPVSGEYAPEEQRKNNCSAVSVFPASFLSFFLNLREYRGKSSINIQSFRLLIYPDRLHIQPQTQVKAAYGSILTRTVLEQGLSRS